MMIRAFVEFPTPVTPDICSMLNSATNKQTNKLIKKQAHMNQWDKWRSGFHQVCCLRDSHTCYTWYVEHCKMQQTKQTKRKNKQTIFQYDHDEVLWCLWWWWHFLDLTSASCSLWEIGHTVPQILLTIIMTVTPKTIRLLMICWFVWSKIQFNIQFNSIFF